MIICSPGAFYRRTATYGPGVLLQKGPPTTQNYLDVWYDKAEKDSYDIFPLCIKKIALKAKILIEYMAVPYIPMVQRLQDGTFRLIHSISISGTPPPTSLVSKELPSRKGS